MRDLEQAIRERAYHLWLADGCPTGNAEVHWLIAQREILASSLEGFGRVTVSEKTAGKKSTRKAKANSPRKRARRVA